MLSEEIGINKRGVSQKSFIAIFPLNDLVNHKNPEKIDKSDSIKFSMQVTEAGLIRYNGKLKVNSTICKWYK